MSAMASQIISISTVCSAVGIKKTPKLHVTGLCEGNPSVTGGSPSQKASNAETVSIWWRHHVITPWKNNTYTIAISYRTCCMASLLTGRGLADWVTFSVVNGMSQHISETLLSQFNYSHPPKCAWKCSHFISATMGQILVIIISGGKLMTLEWPVVS